MGMMHILYVPLIFLAGIGFTAFVYYLVKRSAGLRW